MKWIYSLVLSLLGFAGCGDDDNDNGVGKEICMYGTPTTEFKIKGKVTDAEGNAIPKIVVKKRMKVEGENLDWSYYSDTTDAEGAYCMDGAISPMGSSDPLYYEVQATDVDGAENGGEFVPKIETVAVVATDLEKVDSQNPWLKGRITKIVDIQLEKKADE